MNRIRRRSRALSVLGDVLLTIASIGGAICIALVLAASLFQVSLIMFKTGSMSPTIPAGALAIVREVPATEVAIGDVVTVDRGESALPITHRVIAAEPTAAGTMRLTLKGDANAAADPAPYEVTTVRLVLASFPGLAYVVAAFSSPVALGAISLLVSVLVTAAFWPRRPESETDTRSTRPQPIPVAAGELRPRRSRRGRAGRRYDGGGRASRGAHADRPRRDRRERRAGRHASAPPRRQPRHAAPRGRALGGILIAFTALALATPASPVSAAMVEEVITGEHLILTSIRDPEAMVDMLPGQPVEWQLGVAVSSADPGTVDLTLQIDGTLTTDATGLWFEVRSCPERWTDTGCAPGETVVRALRPAADVAGTTLSLGSMPSTEQRWLLIRAEIPSDPDIASDGYAQLSILALGLGDHIVVDGFTGGALGATGLDPLTPLWAAAASILVGLGLALTARLARWRMP